MAASKPPEGRGKKNGEVETILRVRNESRQSGFTDINFGFLLAWLGPHTAAFMQALNHYARRFNAAAPTYSARMVLIFWSSLSCQEEWVRPSEAMSQSNLARQLSTLRRKYYEANTKRGRSLTTTTNNWASFRKLLDCLIGTNAIPNLDTKSGYLSLPKSDHVLAHRSKLLGKRSRSLIAPKNFNAEGDSYNDDLFEPVSIIHSDEEYLFDYTQRLRNALVTIKTCAQREFDNLVKAQEKGDRLLLATNKEFLTLIKSPVARRKYYDPCNGKHYLRANGGHPNLLGNILSVVQIDMGGIPKPHRKFGGMDGRTVQSSSPYPYWQFIQAYGKNRILPYLGIMTSEAAVACILLLMIDYPKLNATSIYRAKVIDEDGSPFLLTTAGEDSDEIRLTIVKPRAGEEKSVRLSAYCENLIAKVIEWTKPVREEMLKQGRVKEASRLWLGISGLNYDLVAFSEKALLNGLRFNVKFRSHGKVANSTRIVPFVERHPEIKKWAKKLTFKSIRLNSGVLRYLETDGDLLATAKAFGHNNVSTTIGHYIPPALKRIIYERQIRRHQNLMIVSSLDCEFMKLKASDFSTVEELHEFLKGLHSSGLESSADEAVAEKNSIKVESVSGALIIVDDPRALAVAMLYRDALIGASESFLDRPDSRTGVAPRFWIEFIDALHTDLPLFMGDYSELARVAADLKVSLAKKIRLPEIR